MRAAVLTHNGCIEIQERKDPTICGDEYLVRIDSVGICNSDIFRAFAGGAYQYPLVMGHEISGEIIQAGQDARRYSPGTKVVVFPLLPCGKCPGCREKRWALCQDYDFFGSRRDGGFQEYLAVPEWNLIPVPDRTDPSLACLCEPIAVSIHAVKKVAISGAKRTVAVIGAGIIGICAAKMIRDKGHHVTMIDRNEFKRSLCEEIDVSTMPITDANRLESEFDCVIEATGAVAMFHLSVQLAKQAGNVTWLGNIQNDITFEKKEISSILRKELHIHGVWNSDYQEGLSDDWGDALEFIGSSDWLHRVISDRISLNELPAMLEKMYRLKSSHEKHAVHKVIVDISSEDRG